MSFVYFYIQTECSDSSKLGCYCGGWTAFGACSVTCGKGEAIRTRSCSPIAGLIASCPTSSFPTSEKQECQLIEVKS